MTGPIINDETGEELSDDIKRLIPRDFNHYIDPFCGSMQTFIDLNQEGKLVCPMLSDPDDSLINLYEHVKSMPEEFYYAFEGSYRGRTRGALLALRKRYKEIRNHRTMEEAVTYLQINILNAIGNNSTGISGILKRSSTGERNLEFPTETEIVEFSRMLQKIEIKRGCYEAVRGDLSENDFLFLNLRKYSSGNNSSSIKIEQEKHFKKFMRDLEKLQSEHVYIIIKIPSHPKVMKNMCIPENYELSHVLSDKRKKYELWKNF